MHHVRVVSYLAVAGSGVDASFLSQLLFFCLIYSRSIDGLYVNVIFVFVFRHA